MFYALVNRLMMSLTLAIMIHATAVVIDFSKSLASRRLTLLPDSGPVCKVPTDLEGCDDEAEEEAVFAGV